MSDAHKNFAVSLVATAPSPASSGTSLVVTAGDGTKFPAVPFNATIWPANVQATTANAEIVRVTNIATNTFTITRAQEGTSARTVVVGDQIVAGITAKTLTDAENSGYKWVGGSTSESTTTSTSDVDVATVSGLSIAQGTPFRIYFEFRRTTGAVTQFGLGLKINSTVVANCDSNVGNNANEVASGHMIIDVGSRDTNYNSWGLTGGLIYNGGANQTTPSLNGIAGAPNATITSIAIRGRSGSSSVTVAVKNIHVYTLATS